MAAAPTSILKSNGLPPLLWYPRDFWRALIKHAGRLAPLGETHHLAAQGDPASRGHGGRQAPEMLGTRKGYAHSDPKRPRRDG